MKSFYTLLANNALASVTNFTVWFALTFFVFLETQSVFATGVMGGVYLVLTAGCGIWFGGIVDHHLRKTSMAVSSIASLGFYVASSVVFFLTPEGGMRVESPFLWAFMLLMLAGVICGNIRNIVLPTLVTLLVPEDRRAKANGLVGMVAALSFGTVSVISGLMIAFVGMEGVLAFAILATLAALAHLFFLRIEKDTATKSEDGTKKLDLKGTYAIVMGIPGLIALILFTTFNNFLGGAFMALMDAYGLSMVSVEVWGFIFGALSFSFMAGGLLVAKFGLGKNPLRTMMIANIIAWTTCIFFTAQPWLWLLILGMFIWMLLSPFVEASEQTILQEVVPFERQGRVFGFAQSIEQSASPVTAFVVGPLTQFVFIPFMTTGAGVSLIGDWFGVGYARGIALVFTTAGIIGLIVTLIAFNSKPYKLLSRKYAESKSAKASDPAPAA